MKQILLSLLFILQSLVVTAQEHEATMYFHDGTDITGYASIKFEKESFYGLAKDKISFRVSLDDEADLWDEESVHKIVFHDFSEPQTFEYINVTYIDGNQASLFQIIMHGEITIYADASGIWDTKTDKIVAPMPKNLKAKRANEKDFATLTNKKKIVAYFQCPDITERLNSGEFNSRTIIEMVTYYNKACTKTNVVGNADKTPSSAPIRE